VSFDDQAIPESKADFNALRNSVYRTLRSMGAQGGCLVFHPWRKRCIRCGAVFETRGCPRGHREGLEWVEAPHFHAILYGRVDADKRPAGAFVKTIVPKTKRRSWTATLKYVLDHCGVAEGAHALTWWGAWSYNRMPQARIERFGTFRLRQDTERICPHCGTQMVPLVTYEWAEEVRERFLMPWPGRGPPPGYREDGTYTGFGAPALDAREKGALTTEAEQWVFPDP